MANEYGVGKNPAPAAGPNTPPGPSGPAQIPVQPAKQNTGYVRGGVRDGKLRCSGHSGAHRIGGKRK